MSRRRDPRTPDLFDWEPPVVAPEAPETKVRSATRRGRVAKTISLVLKECGMSREEVARRMSDVLGEEVSLNMLQAYASEAREEHRISLERAFALSEATRDPRVLQIGAKLTGYVLVPERYLAAIEDAMLDDKIEELTQRRQMSRRKWKGPRP